MNKYQKLIQERFLDNEEAVINALKSTYETSYKDITKKIESLDLSIERLQKAYNDVDGDEIGELAQAFLSKNRKYTPEEARETLQSMLQSKVYQRDYQKALEKQVDGVLGKMLDNEFKTLSEYLNTCYEDAFIGTMFDLQGQGIPLCFPLDQEAVVNAVQLDSPIKEGLYNHLGENVGDLKKTIASEVSRGISTGMSYSQIARNIRANMMGTYENPGGSYAYALRIARTEGHRIQCQATMDACFKAKDKGADVVKQWDSTLDGKTRESHQKVDGEIRELDEKFSNGLMFPGDPSGGAAEVVNCRCALLQRARWAVGGSFTKMNNFTKQLETFESPAEYDDFKKAFFSKENKDFMKYVERIESKYGTQKWENILNEMTDKEYDRYSVLSVKNPIFNKKGIDFFSESDTIRPGVIRDAIKSGQVSTTINVAKQNRHILNSNGYIEGRSYLNMNAEAVQKLLPQLMGTGEPIFDANGDWTHKERVVCSDFVGTHIDVSTGNETKTKGITIIYSKTGCHIVPRKDDIQ